MRRIGLATVLLFLFGLITLAAPATEAQPQPKPAAAKAKLSAEQLSAQIDSRIRARWQNEGVAPGKPCDDATFFRRIHLDLIGRIPTILDIRDYLDDDRPDKRKHWVDKLLQSESHADHFANVYRQMILSNVENEEAVFLVSGFENWLRKKLKEGAGYDKVVQELLNASYSQYVGFLGNGTQADPSAFLAANENKPENLAGATARLFLGVKIECAQCHKHPFAHWTRTQFWEFAALFIPNNSNKTFTQVSGSIGGVDVKSYPLPKSPTPSLGPQIQIPKTDEWVNAKFLDGTVPTWTDKMEWRKVLAEWVTAPQNPYFARAAVNQVWHYLFGAGLVDPVDDFGKHNPASHPALLDELAGQFIQNGFDLKYLMRAIVNSKTYQLSSAPLTKAQKPGDELEERLFARMPLRALTGEQLFDSLAEIMEYRVDKTRQRLPGLALSPRDEFLAKFATPENKRVDTHTSILQALHLMNGKFMGSATSLEKNKTLGTIAQSEVPTPKKIETLYLVALSRLPAQTELDRLTKYVDGGGATGNQGEALADVFWVLLNSAEFAINH